MKNSLSHSTLIPLLMSASMLLPSSAIADKNCVKYAAATQGGEGGIRMMHERDSFRIISGGGRVEGEICNRDSVRIELAKRDVNTSVGIKIGDERYQFPAGNKGDKRVNSWYRKYFTVNLK